MGALGSSSSALEPALAEARVSRVSTQLAAAAAPLAPALDARQRVQLEARQRRRLVLPRLAHVDALQPRLAHGHQLRKRRNGQLFHAARGRRGGCIGQRGSDASAQRSAAPVRCRRKRTVASALGAARHGQACRQSGVRRLRSACSCRATQQEARRNGTRKHRVRSRERLHGCSLPRVQRCWRARGGDGASSEPRLGVGASLSRDSITASAKSGEIC